MALLCMQQEYRTIGVGVIRTTCEVVLLMNHAIGYGVAVEDKILMMQQELLCIVLHTSSYHAEPSEAILHSKTPWGASSNPAGIRLRSLGAATATWVIAVELQQIDPKK